MCIFPPLERRQQLVSAGSNDDLRRRFFDVLPSASTTSTSTSTSGQFPLSDSMDYHGGGASDVAEEVGYDETGIRPRGRDLHSGPEKGNFYFSTFSLIPNLVS